MLPTLMKNPPRLNPELGRRHHEAARMLRDNQRKAAAFRTAS
jgi:hypothetical protein